MVSGKRARLLARDADQSDRHSLAQKRNQEKAAESALPRQLPQRWHLGKFDFSVAALDEFAAAGLFAPGKRGGGSAKRRFQARNRLPAEASACPESLDGVEQ